MYFTPAGGHTPQLPHDPPAGNEAAEALTVSEGVAGPDGSPGPPARERSGQAALSLLFGLGGSLHQASLVCQGRLDVHLVEPPGHHRQQQHHRGQQARQPERRVGHGGGERPHVGPQEGPVEEESKAEVEDERSPDGDMVEYCPVGGVQGYLGRDDDDEDGGDHGAEQIVVRHHQAFRVSLVVIGSCNVVINIITQSLPLMNIFSVLDTIQLLAFPYLIIARGGGRSENNEEKLTHWNHEEHHGGEETLQGRDGELTIVEKL